MAVILHKRYNLYFPNNVIIINFVRPTVRMSNLFSHNLNFNPPITLSTLIYYL